MKKKGGKKGGKKGKRKKQGKRKKRWCEAEAENRPKGIMKKKEKKEKGREKPGVRRTGAEALWRERCGPFQRFPAHASTVAACCVVLLCIAARTHSIVREHIL